MPAIGVVIGWLVGAIGLTLANWVGRVLVALGISYITFSGVDLLFSSLKTEIWSLLGGAGQLSGVIGLSRIGESVNIVFSALIAKMSLSGMTGGKLTKQVIK
ncbi:MAG: DUF2523 family protein [Gallionella sp.]|nr:DUF2523 family protein [Gallionella sp.]OGS67725.1 MAG: hypothetical protein A2Z87_06185 [Gallionellales bacterium GWA2_54_124]